MEIVDHPFQDCYVVKPKLIEDARGYFLESFNAQVFAKCTGLDVNFVQDNQSFSAYGVIRGLHAQRGEHAQAKLVRVLEGEVLDVIVDGRPGSPTFGQHYSVLLSGENKLQLFVPKGFYHGFSVLSPQATFFYKCDEYYHREAECGVNFADPQLAIDWRVPQEHQLLTQKDLDLPNFNPEEA